MSAYFVATLTVLAFVLAVVKKVNCYDSFAVGVKKGFSTLLSVAPVMICIFIMLEFLSASGVQKYLVGALSPLLKLVGIPEEITELVVLRPFSGSGSLATLETLIAKYGADSYCVRCASVIMASSETVLYITAVYFAGSDVKKTGIVVPVSLTISFISTILACILTRII